MIPLIFRSVYEHFSFPESPNYYAPGVVVDNTREGVINGKGKKTPRDLSKVDTICIHQTAVMGGYGVSKGQINRAKGNRRKALHQRFWKVPYHYVLLRTGDILINNHPKAYTYHGNRCNSFSIGFAIDGKWPGDEWDQTFQDLCKFALTYAVKNARKEGANIQYVTPHGSWSRMRRGDPGHIIWHWVVVPVMLEMGLEFSVKGPRDGGLKIPELAKQWKDKYYKKRGML